MVAKRLAVVLGFTGALAVIPSAALAAETSSAPITVGGQTLSVRHCDVTVLSFTIDPSTGAVSFTGANVDCT
jgi:hypothetical protein